MRVGLAGRSERSSRHAVERESAVAGRHVEPAPDLVERQVSGLKLADQLQAPKMLWE
jgi:hypothetical protein